MRVIHETAVSTGVRLAFERARAEGLSLDATEAIVRQNITFLLEEVARTSADGWPALNGDLNSRKWSAK